MKPADVGLRPNEEPHRLYALVWSMLDERRVELRRQIRHYEWAIERAESLRASVFKGDARGVSVAKRNLTRAKNKLLEHEQRMREWCFVRKLDKLPPSLEKK